MKPAVESLYQRLVLGRRNRWRRHALRQGALALAGYVMVASILGQVSIGAPLDRFWLWVLCLAQFLALAAWAVSVWVWRRNSLADLAAEWDRAHPNLPDPFRISLNVQQKPGDFTATDIQALNALFQPLLQHIQALRLQPWPRWQRYWGMAGAFALAFSCFFSSAPRDFIWRTALPVWAAAKIPRIQFDWPPMELQIAQGDTLTLSIGVRNAMPGQAIQGLVVPKAGGHAQRFDLRWHDAKLRWTLGPFQSDQSLQLQALNGQSTWRTLSVLNPPVLDSLQVTVTPPAYSGLAATTWPEGQLSGDVFQGSQLRWRIRASRLHGWIWVRQFASGEIRDTLPAKDTSTFTMDLVESLEYGFKLCDALGICSALPQASQLPHRIQAVKDQPPTAQILAPLDGTNLDRQAKLGLLLRVQDDIRVMRLELHWKISMPGRDLSQGKSDVTHWLQGMQDGTIASAWDLTPLHLQEDQYLELRLKACDAQPDPGKGCAFSEPVRLQWPEIRQLERQISRQEQDAMDRLQSAAERSQRAEREMQAAQGSRQNEGPPPLQGADVDRIMVQEPSSHHNRVVQWVRQDPALSKQPEGQTILRENLKSIPTTGQSKLSPEMKQRHLQALMQGQSQLQKWLQKEAAEARHPVLQQLADEAAQNLEHQKDLAAYFKDEERQAETQRQQLEAALDEQRRMVEEVQQATQGVEKAMQETRQNGLASPELLKKMEKLQSLMKDLLPDSLRSLLQKKAEGQEVDVDAIREKLSELLDHKAEFEQGIDRALAMMEALQDLRKIESLRQEMDALAREQKELAGKWDASPSKKPSMSHEEKSAKQMEVQKRFQSASEAFQRESEKRPHLQEAREKLSRSTAAEDLKRAVSALKQKGNTSGGKPSASPQSPQEAGEDDGDGAEASKQAAQSLAGLKSSLDALLQKTSRKPKLNKRKLHNLLSQSLELSRLTHVFASEPPIRESQGWNVESPAIRGILSRSAHHLENQLKETLKGLEMGGRLVLKESRALTQSAEAMGEEAKEGELQSVLAANHRLTREILRLMKMTQQSQGSGSGMAGESGDPSQGQGEGEGEGEGSGQGGGDGMDPGDVGEALKGISGQQMAVNQATYQLLRSMLEGRAPAPGPNGAGEGSGAEGKGSGETGNGGKEGSSSGAGSHSNGGSRGGAAGNEQGQVGEALEELAEKASEDGGGAGRLRQLAEEARNLEQDLRNRALSPDDAKRKQERFQMRLLEATRALEERGKQEKREAEAFAGQSLGPAPTTPNQDQIHRRIQAIRERAKKLPIRAIEKEVLDNFYRELLTR
jgi:hypothetical protein